MKHIFYWIIIVGCFTISKNLSAQVVYDNNASVIAATTNSSYEQNAFSIPAADDRLLVVFATLGQVFGSISLDSITFNDLHLIQSTTSVGTNIQSHLWYLPLGSGQTINDTIKIYLNISGSTSIVIGSASYYNVEQTTPFVNSSSLTGSNQNAILNINTSAASGIVVANCAAGDALNPISITGSGINQTEIFSTILSTIGGQGSAQSATGSSNTMSWFFNNFGIGGGYHIVANEILVSSNDLCPNDPNKTDPGFCGCGEIEDPIDTDNDGTPDCADLCPGDPDKTDPGICGCGTPDTDIDNDGTPDCNDLCPDDPNKTDPGACGCGIPDIDTDNDGTPDCNDLCPDDPTKTAPGICGCDIPDTDTDSDGTPDCNDLCPNDPAKIDPGICGCGFHDIDSDNDGTSDCNDLCPNDSLKTNPGLCGCATSDIDSDGDGIPDCKEPGETQLYAQTNPNKKGPMMRAYHVSAENDTTLTWSLGNTSGADSTLTIMQHRSDHLIFGAGNKISMILDTAGRLGVGTQPNKHAVLDVQTDSKNRGVLLPRLSTEERLTMTGLGLPEQGLIIFDHTKSSYWYWSGVEWLEMSIKGSAWENEGNSGTISGTNFIGTTDTAALDFRTNDTIRMRITQRGQIETYGTGRSVFIGAGAGKDDDHSLNDGVFVGYEAGTSNTNGWANTGLGYQSLKTNTNGNSNTAVGYQAILDNTTGYFLTGSGYRALHKNTTGSFNVAFGSRSLIYNTIGSWNSAVGYRAMEQNISGQQNTAIGSLALFFNNDGNQMVAIGDSSLYRNIHGSDNIAVGANALFSNFTGDENTAIGDHALYSNTVRDRLVAVGAGALYHNGIGAVNAGEALFNTAVGYHALYSNLMGYSNTGVGYQVLENNQEGFDNTAIGRNAMRQNLAGSSNVAMGSFALSNNLSGINNTAIGESSLYISNGAHNTAVGKDALYINQDGYYNTAIGESAFTSAPNFTNNSSALGYNAQPDFSDKIVIGNSSVSSIGGQVGWSIYSDARIKTGIQEDVSGLEFIMKLRPVSYQYDIDQQQMITRGKVDSNNWDSKYAIEDIRFSGFLAQQVEEAADVAGYNFSGIQKPAHDQMLYSLRYSTFVVPLVQAVKEQQEMIEELKILVQAQQNQIEVLMQARNEGYHANND